MKKHIIFLLTLCAVLAIAYSLVPIGSYFTALSASCSGVEVDDVLPEQYRKGEELLKDGECQQARQLISDGMAQAKDSDEYYRYVALQAKYFFSLMQCDSFMQCNRQIENYLQRQTGKPTLQQQLLALECQMQHGVYEGKMVGRMDSALAYNLKALEMSKQLPRQFYDYRLLILNNIADAYKQAGKYDQSVRYFRKALELGDSAGMSTATRVTLTIGIASAYAAMGSFEQSNDWWEQAAAMKDQMQPAERFSYLNNRGNDYYLQQQYTKSLECFLELDSIMAGDSNMLWERMFERANLSDVYIKLGQPERALPLLDETEPFFTEQNQQIPLYYLTTQRIELAIIGGRLSEALQIVNDHPTPSWMIPEQKLLRQKVLMQLYEKNGDWQHYSTTLQAYTLLRDSIASDYTKMRFSEALMHYEHEKKMLEQQRVIEEKELSFRWAVAMLLASVVVIVLLLVIIAMKQRERKLREAEMRNSIAGLRMETVRNRITPHFISNALSSEILAQMEGRQTDLSSLVQLLHRGIELTDIEQSTLSEELEFIRFYCNIESRSVGDDFRLDIEMAPDVDADRVSLPSMAVQILVENAIKHGLKAKGPKPGKTRRVLVRATRQQQATLVEVIDNGIGLQGNKRKERTGLRVMRQTMRLLNEQHERTAAAAQRQQLMDYSLEDYSHADGDTGCRAWLLLPDHFDYTLKKLEKNGGGNIYADL